MGPMIYRTASGVLAKPPPRGVNANGTPDSRPLEVGLRGPTSRQVSRRES